MDRTKRLIELTKELETVLPNGYVLMFPTESKTGVSTMTYVPPIAPEIFSKFMGYFSFILEKGSKYRWSKPVSELKIK